MSLKLKINSRARTAYQSFYEEMKKEGYIDNFHQLFTYSFMIGIKSMINNEKIEYGNPKPSDLFQVQSIPKMNLAAVEAIAAIYIPDDLDEDDRFKMINDIAEHGLMVLKDSMKIEGNILLDEFID